jgi:hypothetical protein
MEESSDWCCSGGTRLLPPLPPYTDDFQTFLQTSGAVASSQSRKVNGLFAFSSIGVEGGFSRLPVPSNVAINGRVYHQLRNISQGQHPLRWLLYDQQEQDAQSRQLSVSTAFFDATRRLLEGVNPYIHELRSAFTTIPEGTPLTVEISSSAHAGEIAAIVHVSNVQDIGPRSILIHSSQDLSPARKVSILSPHYEPLQYPLLFPHGTPGWSPRAHPDIESQIDWYRFRLLTEPRFQVFGRLANEYLVDMFSRVEEEKLAYIREGRIEQLDRFDRQREQAFLVDPDSNTRPELASSITLPHTFVGSRAWASEHVADSLALAREIGKPDFLITITTNPTWPEITSQLGPGQSASDIPFIVCRVFRAKVKLALKFIRARFGKVLYMVQVTEFQKRGLPHAHIVLKVCGNIPSDPFFSTIAWSLL